MDFIKYDLRYCNAGQVVEVELSDAANVLLLDYSNLQKYSSGNEYTFYGGHATGSPCRIKIPQTGNWYIVIDSGGRSGTIESSVRVI